jgi:flavin reductase (DIM6/NTAB) family NADH-FMN oxidoreductase RutF
MECRLHQIIKPGSNPVDLVLGEIVHFSIDDSILTDGMPDAAKLDPIARLGGPWYAGIESLFSLPRPPNTLRANPASPTSST